MTSSTTDPFRIPGFPDLSFGTLYCIGRNYAKHAAEMKSDIPETPVVFLKPRNSIISTGETVRIPEISDNVHHEVEMVVLIGGKADSIPQEKAAGIIAAVAVGIDVTARDLQSEAKKAGLPWSLAKGFRTFAPIGNFVATDDAGDIQNLTIRVEVNGEERQAGNTADMIFPVSELISYLSEHFTLFPGDLIFTGTPEGVSQIKPGDTIQATLGDGLSTLQVHVSE
jgi:2-keto-4-pentenoate hydratase/2-oxohepta-3-ene-1,7-dioic acid hydratase in catechol pathway